MILTRFWDGPREIPKEYVQYGVEWITLNPGLNLYNLRWYDILPKVQKDFPELGRVFADLIARDNDRHGIELWVQLADIVGYYCVWKFGGLYVNCDIQPIRPLPELPNTAWASYENNEDGRIVNAAIGAPHKFHEFWGDLLKELPNNYFTSADDEMVMQTGPGYLTNFASSRDDLYIFPRETFNPIHWRDIPRGGDASGFAIPESSVAVHHWGHKKDGRSNRVETATQ